MDAGSVVDGRYEVCRPLGVTGGMGDVYLCLDRKLKRQVAVKLIKPEHSAEPEYRERFQREVDAALALEGYDVVRIYDHGECADQKTPYYVMEYLQGRDLGRELAAHGPLELSRALGVLLDTCRVIGAAHSRGIVHRDLKPSNLFLEGPPSPRRSVRVLDFGVARVLGDPRDGALTGLGGQPGSPNYMSPEQHTNDLQVGIQADIWALGAILYEMVVGEKAWPGPSWEARQRVLEDATPSVRKIRSELPTELDRVIRKCLEKDPAARYSSVPELEGDLRSLQSSSLPADDTLTTFAGAASRRGRFGSRRWQRTLAWGGLGVVLLLLAGAWLRKGPAITPAADAAGSKRARDLVAEDVGLPPAPRATSKARSEPPRGSSDAPPTPEPGGALASSATGGSRGTSTGLAPKIPKLPRPPATAAASRSRPPASAPKLPRNETKLRTE
jgi:serine/threonine protein kinase